MHYTPYGLCCAQPPSVLYMRGFANLRYDHLLEDLCQINWLLTSDLVLLKHHIRTSKSVLLVDEVQLLQANPQHAHIQ